MILSTWNPFRTDFFSRQGLSKIFISSVSPLNFFLENGSQFLLFFFLKKGLFPGEGPSIFSWRRAFKIFFPGDDPSYLFSWRRASRSLILVPLKQKITANESFRYFLYCKLFSYQMTAPNFQTSGKIIH